MEVERIHKEVEAKTTDTRRLLSPCSIPLEDDSHLAVDDLKFALAQTDLRNVAVTGNYGSGKSSVVNTCFEELGIENRVLRISMSTFQLTKGEKPTKEDLYSDDIEYKIVQHLLYKCDKSKIPDSGFQHINPIGLEQLSKYIKLTFIAIACFIIAFEPSLIQIDSIYDAYYRFLGESVGWWVNLIADIGSIGYLVWYLYKVCLIVSKKLSRIKMFRIEAQGVTLEASTEVSVFNKYMDEILYIIRENAYDYILFEDLDRLVNSDKLFLKIRELNMLINESEDFKKRKRTIRFIYAIKDDVFTRELRTKCFDYIVAVVPVVDHYNVIDYLIAEYRGKNLLHDISDTELEQITSRLTGLRELKNVMNEYSLYERSYKSHLSDDANDYEKKLLALIVYKNLYPQDFALVYEKKGLLYSVLSQRRKFDGLLTKGKKDELVVVEGKIEEAREKIISLRKRYLDVLEQNNVRSLNDKGYSYTVDEVVNSDLLWGKFMKDDYESYYYVDELNEDAGDSDYDFVFKDIENEVNADMGYEQSARSATSDYYQNYLAKPELEKQIREIEHTNLRDVFRKAGAVATKPVITEIYNNIYKSESDDDNSKIDVIQTFIYNGYLDEDYYLYISKFYPGTLSENDYQFTNDILQGIVHPYDTKLGNVKAIVKKLRKDDFENKCILNYDILEYLMSSSGSVYLSTFIETVRRYPNFIVGYYQGAQQPDDDFFLTTFQEWNGCVRVIQTVESDIDREILLLLFFKVLPLFVKLTPDEIGYLEEQYEFVCNHIDKLDISEIKNYLKSNELKFTKLIAPNDKTRDLYHYCLMRNLFVINAHNVEIVLGEGFKTATITSLLSLDNKYVKDYLQKNLSVLLGLIPNTSCNEGKEALIYLIDSEIPTDEWVTQYLTKQIYMFDDLTGFDAHHVGIILAADKLIPTWHHVLEAFKIIGLLDDTLNRYIIGHSNSLSKEKCLGDSDIVSALHQQLFTGEKLPMNEFKQLMRSFDIFFSLDELKEISDERISEVIKQKKVGTSTSIFTYLNQNCSEQVADDYLVLRFDGIMADNTIEWDNYIRNSMGINVLNSKLSLNQKKQFMNDCLLITKGQADSWELAKLICFYYELCDVRDAVKSLIIDALTIYQGDNSWELKIKLINKCNEMWEYNRETENKMLKEGLGGEYEKLTYARGWAKFDINEENRTLLEFLKSKGHYISKIDPQEGQYYVTFKHS